MSLVNQSIIKHKMGLLNLAEELQNVSQACRVMGVSRDTFYRVKEAKESGGMEALLYKDRRRANLEKSHGCGHGAGHIGVCGGEPRCRPGSSVE
jgi:homoserine acetyltransferase